MVRYHISPKTQRPNKCTAQEGRCPLGGGEGEVPHFPTKEAAKAHVEAQEAARHQEAPLGTLKKEARGRKKGRAKDEAQGGPTTESLLRETIASLPTWKSTTREDLLQEQVAFLQEDSPFLCSFCQAPYSNLQSVELAGTFVECSACGECDDMVTATLVVQEEQFADVLEDVSRVKARRWVHATQRKDWEKTLTSDRAVHLGAPEAAVDRAFTIVDGDLKRPWDFYLVEVREDAEVEEEIQTDTNEAFLDDSTSPSITTVIYENRWEGSGTLSLETYGSMLKVVGKETYSLQELRRLKGLHSIENEAMRRGKEEMWRRKLAKRVQEEETLREKDPRPFMDLPDEEVKNLQGALTIRRSNLEERKRILEPASDSWFQVSHDLQDLEITLGNLRREGEARGW